MGCITRPAFLPLRGRRAASQFAPRAGRACSATRTTLHKLRHAGSRSRAASKLQATDAICSPRCMEFNQRDFRRAARVPRSCRDVYFDISIDIPHASACLLHLRWTRRRHDLDQSNPVLRRRGPAATLLFESMEQIELFQTVRNTERPTGPQQRSRDFNRLGRSFRLKSGVSGDDIALCGPSAVREESDVVKEILFGFGPAPELRLWAW